MLNCIIGMVDKARRALAVLQERSIRDREELSIWMRRHPDNDHDLKKRGGPETWSNMRNSDDRIDDVRRRAGEVVLLYTEIYQCQITQMGKACANKMVPDQAPRL